MRARMEEQNLRGQIVNAGGSRHGCGEVAFVGDVVGESGGAGCESGGGGSSVGEGSDGEWSQAASGAGE